MKSIFAYWSTRVVSSIMFLLFVYFVMHVSLTSYYYIVQIAEKIRILLHYVGEDFEDVQYVRGEGPEFSREDWLSKKFTLGYDFPNVGVAM